MHVSGKQIPTDVLLYDILPSLSYSDLISLCQSNRDINQLCQNEKLWEMKLRQDFPDAPMKPNNVTVKKYYQLLTCALIIPIEFAKEKEQKIGHIFIIPTITTFRSVLSQIDDLLIKNSLNYIDYSINFDYFPTILNKNGIIYSRGSLHYLIKSITSVGKILVQPIEFGPIVFLQNRSITDEIDELLLPICPQNILKHRNSNLNFMQREYRWSLRSH